jgi:hypothetical protein
MIHPTYSAFLNRSSLRILTEPTAEQISLAEAYLHLRLDAYGSPEEHPDDPWLSANISTAREWCEGYSGRILAPTVMRLSMTRFPSNGIYSPYRFGYFDAWGVNYCEAHGYPVPIDLKVAPVMGIQSIEYIDGDGNAQTMSPANYVLDNQAWPCLVYPAYGVSWPTTRQQANAVTITFHAGHTLASDSPNDAPLPKRYKSAMLLVLGHLYENRENTVLPPRSMGLVEIPLGAAELMQRDMIRMGMS